MIIDLFIYFYYDTQKLLLSTKNFRNRYGCKYFKLIYFKGYCYFCIYVVSYFFIYIIINFLDFAIYNFINGSINIKLYVFLVALLHRKAFFPFFQTFGNVQSAQIICEQNNQSSLVKSSDEISLSSFSDQLSSISFTSSSSTSLLTTDFSIPLQPLTSKENEKNEKLSFEVNVEDCSAEHTALEAVNVVPNLDDKILDLINVEAAEATFKEIEKNVQQLRRQSVSQEDTEDLQAENPLFSLLQKGGLRCRELVNHSQRHDLVPEWRDINIIAKITAKHLLNLAIPPKRKILSSTLTRWAQYFKCLFPKTPTSCFYDFKYEPSQRRDGTIIQKKRAEGALQVQLFQERRKLIKEDRTVLLRRPSIPDGQGSSNSSNIPHNFSQITNTWRSAGLQEEEVRSSKISITGNFSIIVSYIIYFIIISIMFIFYL